MASELYAFDPAGLISPATVTEQIFANAKNAPAGTVSVQWMLDGQPLTTETQSPFWLGGMLNNQAVGFSIHGVSAGSHTLVAAAKSSGGQVTNSTSLTLNVVPSINSTLSATLMPYANHPTAQSLTVSGMLAATSTPGLTLTSQDTQIRQQVATMYANWGYDISLDANSSKSSVLSALLPKGWAANTSSLTFSPDTVFYQPIPASWPKVALPKGYFSTVQLNSTRGPDGDGIGYGVTDAASSDPLTRVRSEYPGAPDTRVDYQIRIPTNWQNNLPSNPDGDMHMIFEDPTAGTYLSSYKTSADPSTGVDAWYASPPTPFNSLGDRGGSDTIFVAERPFLLKPGESVGSAPVNHALGGPVERVWRARSYPATGYDDGLQTGSVDNCGGSNEGGLVPYGALLQLDPSVNIAGMSLSVPAKKILQAMQTYGYYVVDFGCSDMDIYTMVDETEWEPYGGAYGNSHGPGVQNEIQSVIAGNVFYVLPPPTKKGALLAIHSPAVSATVNGTTLAIGYTYVHGVTGLHHAVFQVDGGAASNDTALSGSFQLSNMTTGAHLLKAFLATSANAEIVGSEVQVPFTVQGGGGTSACDTNSDGNVNVLDVQSAVNQAIGAASCTTADLQGNGTCNVIDVQRIVVATLGGSCVTGP